MRAGSLGPRPPASARAPAALRAERATTLPIAAQSFPRPYSIAPGLDLARGQRQLGDRARSAPCLRAGSLLGDQRRVLGGAIEAGAEPVEGATATRRRLDRCEAASHRLDHAEVGGRAPRRSWPVPGVVPGERARLQKPLTADLYSASVSASSAEVSAESPERMPRISAAPTKPVRDRRAGQDPAVDRPGSPQRRPVRPARAPPVRPRGRARPGGRASGCGEAASTPNLR